MWKNKNLPVFGNLKGIKVVHSTISLAGPFGVELLADHGADVIWIENSKGYDLARYGNNLLAEAERKNQRAITLDVPSPEGRKIFFELIKDADVFVENSKGGQWDKWGLTDEVMWDVNPKLVICHVSGFGQTGVPEYVSRPSYDAIAQAVSGYTAMQVNPQTAPYPVGPYAADYFTAYAVAFGVCAALVNVAKTGKGESIDVSQVEVMARTQANGADLLNGYERNVDLAGNPSSMAGWGCLPCKDGVYVQCCLIGGGVLKKTCEFLGIEYGSELIPKGTSIINKKNNPEGAAYYEGAILKYLATKTAVEAEAEFLAAGLPVSRLNKVSDLVDDPHWQARGLFVEHETMKGLKLTTVGPIPKMKNNPGQIWRGSPYPGQDNEDILSEIGLTDEQIKALYEAKIITKGSAKDVYPYEMPLAVESEATI